MDSKEKIIIIEDSNVVSKMLKKQLEISGFEVKVYENPENVIESITNNQPSCIVSDLMMPVMTGLEFLKIIKENDTLKHIPVIMLTAVGNEDSVKEAISLGVFDYMVKPFSHMELVDKIKKAIRATEIK